MAVRVSARSGYDLEYMLKGQVGDGKEQTAGGYYMNAAQAGEAPGRWYGAGATALGFAPGSQVAPEPFRKVYSQVNLQTGEQLGRRPGGYAKFAEILARLLEAEPHATAERRLELEREAAKAARRSPVYTNSAAEFDKTISVVHASIRETPAAPTSPQTPRLSGCGPPASSGGRKSCRKPRERYRVHAASRRVDAHRLPRQAGRRGRAEPMGAGAAGGDRWLQGTNREGEPHDHVHVVWARMAKTASDGKWRSLDTMRLRGQLGGMAAVVAAYVESALTREFGVEWVARDDGIMGNEIRGVTQEWKDAYSTRTEKVDAKQREMAASFERKYGRAPNTREMLFIRHAARDQSKLQRG